MQGEAWERCSKLRKSQGRAAPLVRNIARETRLWLRDTAEVEGAASLLCWSELERSDPPSLLEHSSLFRTPCPLSRRGCQSTHSTDLAALHTAALVLVRLDHLPLIFSHLAHSTSCRHTTATYALPAPSHSVSDNPSTRASPVPLSSFSSTCRSSPPLLAACDTSLTSCLRVDRPRPLPAPNNAR